MQRQQTMSAKTQVYINQYSHISDSDQEVVNNVEEVDDFEPLYDLVEVKEIYSKELRKHRTRNNILSKCLEKKEVDRFQGCMQLTSLQLLASINPIQIQAKITRWIQKNDDLLTFIHEAMGGMWYAFPPFCENNLLVKNNYKFNDEFIQKFEKMFAEAVKKFKIPSCNTLKLLLLVVWQKRFVDALHITQLALYGLDFKLELLLLPSIQFRIDKKKKNLKLNLCLQGFMSDWSPKYLDLLKETLSQELFVKPMSDNVINKIESMLYDMFYNIILVRFQIQ